MFQLWSAIAPASGQWADIGRSCAGPAGTDITNGAVEAMGLIGTIEMHPSDKLAVISRRPERMGKRRDVRWQIVVIAKHARDMRLQPGQERHPRRHAKRRGAVAVVKPRALTGQGVQRRRVREGIARAAKNACRMLVGHDHDDIGAGAVFCCHRVFFMAFENWTVQSI